MTEQNNVMPLDVANFIAQRPLSTRSCLVPLFETITNSADAIRAAKRTDGLITIHIVREPARSVSSEPGVVEGQPVTGFVVEDNGIGFIEKNFDSFKMVGSQQKVKQGGKGMGRLTWLKAFGRAEIDSSFEAEGKHFHRTFSFSLLGKFANGENLIGDYVFEETNGGNLLTKVKLAHYFKDYKKACPTTFNVLVRRIIRQFLSEFIFETFPQIILVDEFEARKVDLMQYFKNEMQLRHKESNFTLDKQKFFVQHLCLAGGQESSHEIHFCARKSSVESRVGQDLIPSLRGPLHADEGKGKAFFYTACISGPWLEQTARNERTSFDIPYKKDCLDGEKEITWDDIHDKVARECEKFLADYLRPQRDDNKKRITNYILKYEPKYRPLIKHKSEWFDRIPPTVPDENLGIELYKLWSEYGLELKAKERSTMRRLKNSSSLEDRKKVLRTFLEEWNDHGSASLAEYVVHRRAVLDFLRESISISTAEKYASEAQIHSIICPMRKTSDDVSSDQMNLWIIDERLAYHHFLSSDKSFDSLEPVKIDSQERTDLLIFKQPVAFTDETFGAIVLVEFKKPLRNDYTEKQNPISQVYGYIEKLRTGKEVDKNGRPIDVGNKPIFAYIVADPTSKLKRWIKENDFTALPDDGGWFHYHNRYGAYVEVMTFRKLLGDAEKRNAAFFEKLNIPLPQGPTL